MAPNYNNKIELPNPPKSFGSWLNFYTSISKRLDDNIKRVVYYEEGLDSFDCVEIKEIEVSLLCEYALQETIPSFEVVKKLNEELTAENTMLIQANDSYVERVNELISQVNLLKSSLYELELTSIKSKWWYKLMTWGW